MEDMAVSDGIVFYDQLCSFQRIYTSGKRVLDFCCKLEVVKTL